MSGLALSPPKGCSEGGGGRRLVNPSREELGRAGAFSIIVKLVVEAKGVLARGEALSDNARIVNTVVIPAYNEEKGLPVLLEKLFQVIGDTYEVIVVDDGSTDGTPEVARRFACRLIQHEVNQGKGRSLLTGIQESRGEVVVWVDADDTYPVAVIPQMVAQLRSRESGYDLVSAWRCEGRQHMPWLNRVGNVLFTWTVRIFYRLETRDACTGLRGTRREHLAHMDLTGKRFTIDCEIALKAGRMGLRNCDIPIDYGKRLGRQKLSGLRDGAQIALTLLRHVFWQAGEATRVADDRERHA